LERGGFPNIVANVEFPMPVVQKYTVTDQNQKNPPKTADRKDGSGRRDAAARAKDIMARFPKTIAYLAK
jgi:hypothetical protein